MQSWLRSLAVSVASFLCLVMFCPHPQCQLLTRRVAHAGGPSDSPPAAVPVTQISHGFGDSAAGGSGSATSLPAAPEPGLSAANEPWDVAPAGTAHQAPLSRIGIGANVSPLGIGINGTTVLSDFFDARLMGNFFGYTSPRFDVEGFKAIANLHLASMAASLDWYPFNSVWRLSPGLMFYNANQFSMTASVAGGTSFTLNGQTFYSATANAATGATPLTGSGLLGLHPRPIAFTAAGGFGKFVPRSRRHWSFPSEFGVVFMGAPTANVNVSGWVCLDQKQTECSQISTPGNPIAQQFNTALQAQLTKWRRDLAKVPFYPIFSYSVVYSFNLP
jgi:hypothetical protein